ncbi:hypothetical protein CFHF_23470 [Caulobacter flavus]|uniref:Restriction endonuclease type IV Mrr domain-containing protein n=1 Tax=Caulobacter flavus TaxID=1679497 RepID=A0A2N5CLU1_9CAUL|nr:hypothetical protein [Caulobacter flavus]AYV48194.1 hypothetical protein C1707_19085 [Caulobacter flavus]PLR06881.1 hypothetical protein CFHF_23470 [Caulobacter flavus]
MDFLDKQIAPPRSWDKFEELTRAVFAELWSDPHARRHGRSGQKQFGVDVFGNPVDSPGKTFGVQCKGKNVNYGAVATIEEFDAELAKAELFSPPLGHWTFVTTAPDDGPLQRHAQAVSEQRLAQGLFPVVAFGWETMLALIALQPNVISAFYPEHSGVLRQVLATLKGLPSNGQLADLLQAIRGATGHTPPQTSALDWVEVRFEAQRGLGPALMGRPLGPADVVACPTLPEVSTLLEDLARAGSARLAGVAGAGKSICALQTAHALRAHGWRVMRLLDPTGAIPSFAADDERTIYLIDDAHLANPGQLRVLEEATDARRRLLTTHTSLDGKTSAPGTVHLDAKRAVKVIAAGLRATPEQTLAAVKAADDRVGDRIGDERLEHRLEAAEAADFPWQFCFTLGGGWRRAKSMADSARAASADLVLAAAAVRQLASRDAPCALPQLQALVGDELRPDQVKAAVAWLVGQRLLLSETDLRCPHQRLAGALLDQILDGQAAEGRALIGRLITAALTDPALPLGGFALLLRELTSGHAYGRWNRLFSKEALCIARARVWIAASAAEVREACWFLNEASSELPDAAADFEAHLDVFAGWVESAPGGACYALSAVIGRSSARDTTALAIRQRVSAAKIADAINAAPALYASEITELISALRSWEDQAWIAAFLAALDRKQCLALVSSWPADAWLSSAASYCQNLFYVDEALGLDLVEALIPAVAERVSADPQYAFHELDDIVRDTLRVHDVLEVFVGKLAPTKRMKQLARQLCRCWDPRDLGAKLSLSTQRNFQTAAFLLLFMSKVAPKQFEATILAMDWNAVDAAIGKGWENGIGDARMLLSVASGSPAGRNAVKAMIERNEPRIASLSLHLANLNPDTAIRHIAAGKPLAVAPYDSVEWLKAALVGARLAVLHPELLIPMLAPHYTAMAKNLSQASPSYWNEAQILLTLIAERDPAGLSTIFDQIDPALALVAWRNGLQGLHAEHRRGRSFSSKDVAAFLVHHALARTDAIGDVARALRRQFPKTSIPPDDHLEPLDLTKMVP